MHTKTAPNVQERIALFLIALQYKYTTGYQIKKYVRFCCKSYNYYTRKDDYNVKILKISVLIIIMTILIIPITSKAIDN